MSPDKVFGVPMDIEFGYSDDEEDSGKCEPIIHYFYNYLFSTL